ncbi:MAG: hypothetical protein Ct9H300mP21_01580 [Pseudomonadota bacterium]|nr:MAG: hypothetical protein Ct9H300mP21_01580 [Pseudomonadota bacterium]
MFTLLRFSPLCQNIIKCCNQSGLDVEDIVLNPFVSSQAALSPDEQEVEWYGFDMGRYNRRHYLFRRSIVHTAVLALGGNHLTHDIPIGLGAPFMKQKKLNKFLVWRCPPW